MTVAAIHLPTVNAVLNALAATLLVAGFIAIRRRHREVHRRCMLAALATSTLFLVSYVTHKAIVAVHTPFPGDGAARAIYFAILISHTLLAVAVVPLALRVVVHARRERWEKHRRLARITFPVWVYVSVTGVVIWWMLYSGTFAPAAPPSGG
jgi:uncharacterized membrane protein YozB (DUF420 family)